MAQWVALSQEEGPVFYSQPGFLFFLLVAQLLLVVKVFGKILSFV